LLSKVRVCRYSKSVFFRNGMISYGFRSDSRQRIVNAIPCTSGIGSFMHRNSFRRLFDAFRYWSKFSFSDDNIVYLISWSGSLMATFMNLSKISYITFLEIICYPMLLLFLTYNKQPALAVAFLITAFEFDKYGSTASFTNTAKLSCWFSNTNVLNVWIALAIASMLVNSGY
jgi:hypothetical protein